MSATRGKAGRGSDNKQASLIALETTEENRPIHAVLTPLASFSKTALATWGERHLTADAEVFTDGLAAFNALCDAGHPHTVLVADSRRGACNQPRSRWVNTLLGNVKRSLDGTYHAICFTKYAHRYLAEAAWRFNHRFNLAAILRHAVYTHIHAKHWTEKALRAIPSSLADGSRESGASKECSKPQ
ncbi:MAG: IS1595 family transposase [Aquimonas sp.]|nr:IS1595 family transposase [Xanthomonadales bacterium]MCC6505924.1 IS1595 family transposase [Aquimonas sp.]